MKGVKIKYNKEDLEIAIKNSNTYIDVFRFLKLCPSNYKFLKQKIKQYDLDISHFNQANSRKGKVKRTLNELLVKDSNITVNYSDLKQKLYNSNLKQPICELCEQDEYWHNKKMSLILDHINGDRYDNRLENLRIVCPNCNATLDTHCGKNKKGGEERNKRDKVKKKINEVRKTEKLEERKNLVINSNIDFNKKGWRLELSNILNFTPQASGNFVKKYMPEFYDKCWKHIDNKFENDQMAE